ncbi:MAG: peptidoglycan-binding protein [Anaerolineales bacterium]|nr:peptidoglycan-binding protein [Anaerolineales bacterium]
MRNPSNKLIYFALILSMLAAACGKATITPASEPALTAAAPEPSQTLPATTADTASETPVPAQPSPTAMLSATDLPPSATSPTAPPISGDGLTFTAANLEGMEELTALSNGKLGFITDVLWAPDGMHLALAGRLGVGWMDVATMEMVWVSAEAPQNATLQITPDGKRLLALNRNGEAQLLDTANGQELGSLATVIANATALSPDGSMLAVAFDDSVQIVPFATRITEQTLYASETAAPIITLAYSPDGKRLLAGCVDGDVQVWEIESGELRRDFDSGMPDYYFCSVPNTSSGGWLALTCQWPSNDYNTVNHEIWLWDPANDEKQNFYTITDDNATGYYDFTFGPGRTRMAVQAGGQLEVWTLIDGFYRVGELPVENYLTVDLDPSTQGRLLAVRTWNGVQIWDSDSATLLNEYAPPGSNAGVVHLAFNPAQARALALGRSDGSMEIWDVSQSQLLHTLEAFAPVNGMPDPVVGLAYSTDGQTLAAGSTAGIVHVWDMAGETPALTGEVALQRSLKALALSPDGKTVALSYYTGMSGDLIDLCDSQTLEQKMEIVTYPVPISVFAFSPDGLTLAAGGSEGQIQFWAVSNGTLRQTLETNSGEAVNALAYSADGKMLAVTSGEKLQVWDLIQGKLIRGWKDVEIELALAFHPDQCSLASSVAQYVDVLDLASGEFFLSLTNGSDWDTVNDLAFSADGRLLAIGSQDGLVSIWGVAGALQRAGSPPEPLCHSIPPAPTATPTLPPTQTPLPSPTPVVTATFTPTPYVLTRNLYLSDPHLRGDDVLALQERLLALGYSEVEAADGDFGTLTDGAVRRFQELNGLEADGVVGPMTWQALWSPEAVRGD